MPGDRARPKPVGVDAHNRVLKAAYARADDLEGRLVRILQPILEQAGSRAATAFSEMATDHLTAAGLRREDRLAALRAVFGGYVEAAVPPTISLVAAGGLRGVRSTSTMVCLKPRPEEADAIADPGGAPAETLHVTLVSLGSVEGDLSPVVEAVRQVAAVHAPLVGRVGGYGQFQPPGCGILLPDVPGLVELRVAVTEALVAAEIDYARDHGYQPHMTVDGAPEADEAEQMMTRAGEPLHFDAILVVRGDSEVVEVPLVGTPPLTAAGAPESIGQAEQRLRQEQDKLRSALESGDQRAIGDAKTAVAAAKANLRDLVVGPRWTAPAGDELLDVKALTQTLRTKTDPVRQALVKTTMEPSLAQVGLDFEVTNPLTAKVLAQSGSQIEGIADTTRANVMKIVSSAYEEGLSIPDTAKAIRDGMQAAAPARATMIARTELAGAVNGGSLAATQLVSEVTGESYTKRWLTAPGAKNPRHELYDGLDGQTAPLDGVFQVGEAELSFPGDPDGDPGETINCRCTLIYDSAQGEQEADADTPPDLEV